MPIRITLPIRTWAALDAALVFFRSTPPSTVAGARQRTLHCRRLHQALLDAGVRAHHIRLDSLAKNRPVLRLWIESKVGLRNTLPLDLPLPVVRTVARTCLSILEVQGCLASGPLVTHEAEELQALQAFLTEARRQNPSPRSLVPPCRRAAQLRWDESRGEYAFLGPMIHRLHQYYRRTGASVN